MTKGDFSEFQVGKTVDFVRTITKEDVESFAKLTGDDNPLHLDDEYAKCTVFRGTVSHGMLTASFISTVIGTLLPGPGALWLSQTLEFLEPVRPGDTVRIVATVTRTSPAQRIIELSIKVFNQRDSKVLEGASKVRLLKMKINKTTPDITGMVALVTGSSRGIGAAVARQLALQGYRVAINYSTNEKLAGELVNSIKSAGGQAMEFQADIGNAHEAAELISTVNKEMGSVAVLVNNAWPRLSQLPFCDLNWENFQRQIDIGVKGAFICSKAVIPQMIEAGFGRIVSISSIFADNVPPLNQADYVIAKAALSAMTRCIALEFGPKGITANIVSPGMTETDFLQGLPQKARMLVEAQCPLRRIAEPEDVAKVVGFLTSPGANFVSGETVRVCGGQMML